MKIALRNGLRAGVIFSIVIIFLVLIGFHVVAVSLISQIFRGLNLPVPGLSSGFTLAMLNMLIFLGLLGIWAGWMGARRSEPDIWSRALAGGLAAGAANGLLVGLFALLLSWILAQGIDVRKYLAALSPQAISLFTFGLPPAQALLLHFAFLTFAGLAGGVLARGLGRGAWRAKFSARVRESLDGLRTRTPVTRLLRSKLTTYAVYSALIIFALLLPRSIGQYWNYTAGTVLIYVLLGLGLNIVVGLAGLLDLGYVAFFAIGAYTFGLLTAPEPHQLEWSFWIALPVAVALAALAGILLGIPVLRLRGDYLAIVTLGFGEIIRVLSRSDLLTPLTAGPRGIRNIAGPTLFGRPLNSDIAFVYLIFLAVLLIIFVTNRLQNSRVGRGWIAMREDEIVARAQGINTWRFKLLAFGIGAAFAGLGGALFASRNQFTGPEDHVLMVSINVLALVIVGGMGSIPGVIAGSFVLKGLPEMMRELENYRILAFGALLVAMMIFRPEGLIPSARRRLEIHTVDEEEALPEPVQPASTDTPSLGIAQPADATDSSDVAISIDSSPKME